MKLTVHCYMVPPIEPDCFYSWRLWSGATANHNVKKLNATSQACFNREIKVNQKRLPRVKARAIKGTYQWPAITSFFWTFPEDEQVILHQLSGFPSKASKNVSTSFWYFSPSWLRLSAISYYIINIATYFFGTKSETPIQFWLPVFSSFSFSGCVVFKYLWVVGGVKSQYS